MASHRVQAGKTQRRPARKPGKRIFNKTNFTDGGGFYLVFAAVVVIIFGLLYIRIGSVT